MGVLKNGPVGETGIFSIPDFEAEAADIVARAKRVAARIINDAKSKEQEIRAEASRRGESQGVDEGLQKGLEEGHQKGYDEAFNEVRDRTTTTHQHLEKILSEISNRYESLYKMAEVDLLTLSLAIAERIVKTRVAVDTTVVQENLKAAMAFTVDRGKITVRINPEEFSVIEAYLPKLNKLFNDIDVVDLVPDETVSLGGCMVSNRLGDVDNRIEKQIERIGFELAGIKAES